MCHSCCFQLAATFFFHDQAVKSPESWLLISQAGEAFYTSMQRHGQQAGRCVGSHSVLQGPWLQVTTSAAKIAVNDQISCLLLKMKRCRQIFVHTSREDAGSLAFSPLTRVLWVTVGQAAFLCCDCGGGRWTGQSFCCLQSLITRGASLQLLGCAEREGAVAQSHLSYSATELLMPVNWLGVASEREALIQLFKPSVLTGKGCWSIFSLQVECEVVSELHNSHMINGRLGILGIPWRSGQLGQHFLI